MTEGRAITPEEEKILEAARGVARTYRAWQGSFGGIRRSVTRDPGRVEDEVAIGKRTHADFYEAVRALVKVVSEGKGSESF